MERKQWVLAGEHISQSYENTQIISDITLHVNEGELVCLLGVSGIGKTTLFHILSGLKKPDLGRVLIHGKDVTGTAGQVSYMQQKDLLLPFATIIDNVSMPLTLKGVAKKEAQTVAALHFEEFGLLGFEKKYPAQLSGGMRQRAALLRAYLFSDQIMLLDEPFSALDALTKSGLHRWFREIVSTHHTSTLFITHDMDEAILLSDRIYVMSGTPGRITDELAISSENKLDPKFVTSKEFVDCKRTLLEKIV